MSLFQSKEKAQCAGTASAERLSDREYREIARIVYAESRINLGANKRELVTARLAKRLRILGLPDFGSYINLLASPTGATEMTNFVDAISTNHTYFFREGEHFNFLSREILPAMSRGRTSPFRLWCAAASSGEEPYTLAITLEEYFSRTGGKWQMECTDISTRVLQTAREGIYPAEKLSKVSPELTRRYFQKGVGPNAGRFRVTEKLRSKLRFSQLNLLGAPYPFKNVFDVIFCRNVMIYFDKQTQQELVDRMTPLLAPGGYLLIGHAESLTGIRHPFRCLKPAIYQKSQ